MAKVRHSRLQAKKRSTMTLINNYDSSPNDLTSYRRLASERGKGLGKRGEQWTEVLSWEPRAFLYHNFLSKEECEYLIKLAKPHMAKSTVVDNETGKSKDSSVRTSSGMFLTRGQDKIIRDIEERIADYTFIPVENGEGLQVLRYEVGQKYDAHFDYFLDEFNTKNGGQRMATILMYLSDVEEGGETIFPAAKGNISAVPWWNELSECGKQGLAVKPKMGDALLFWSMRPDGTLDPSSLHGACPVIKGNKWSCPKWMHVEEYKFSRETKPFIVPNSAQTCCIAAVIEVKCLCRYTVEEFTWEDMKQSPSFEMLHWIMQMVGWCREKLVTFIRQMSLQLPSSPGLLSALTYTIKQSKPCLFHHTGSGLLYAVANLLG
ncbi:putative prolyl 4-hydroxylase 10 [Hibiscus syriacus]|uniref:procollagen-proline 4-dioxygenase n=1 Tax=Hibiscus syriacus TaxID=106335 RepID=A0A6A3BKC4_HIBSY|nr:putative prolyl 4-hydroxylase 10 [Hibiscus syriacus]